MLMIKTPLAYLLMLAAKSCFDRISLSVMKSDGKIKTLSLFKSNLPKKYFFTDYVIF